MKKSLVAGLLIAAFLLTTVPVARAQSMSAADEQALIQTLLVQIAYLQQQILAILQQRLTTPTTTTTPVISPTTSAAAVIPTVTLQAAGYTSTGYQEPQINVNNASSVTFSWSAPNASYCNTYGQTKLLLTDGTYWDVRKMPTSGSKTFNTYGQKDGYGNNVYYTSIGVQCWNGIESVSDSKGMTIAWNPQVQAPLTMTAYAVPSIVNPGQQYTFYWSSTGASYCGSSNTTASTPRDATTATTGSTIGYTYSGVTITKTCFNDAGQSTSASATISVNPQNDPNGIPYSQTSATPLGSNERTVPYTYPDNSCGTLMTQFIAPGSVSVGSGPVFNLASQVCSASGMYPNVTTFRAYSCQNFSSAYSTKIQGSAVFAFQCSK